MALYKLVVTVSMMLCGSVCAMQDGCPALPAAQREAAIQHQMALLAARERAREADHMRTMVLSVQPDPHSSVWRSADGTTHVRLTRHALLAIACAWTGCGTAWFLWTLHHQHVI